MKLNDLVKEIKESQEEFLARTLWVCEWPKAYVLVWLTEEEMNKKTILPKKMSWDEAQAYYITLESRPSGPICKHYIEGKVCKQCGGYSQECKGVMKGRNENE